MIYTLNYEEPFNLAGFVALALGIASFFVLFDPIGYVPRFGFHIIGGSVPSAVVAGVAYYALFKLTLKRSQPALVS